MKKTILTLWVLLASIALSAKQWPISTSLLTQYTIEVPDEFVCVYDGDSAKTNTRYVFAKEEQSQLYLDMVVIDNLNVKKAKALPDTILLPSLKEKEIISRIEKEEGLLSRIITVRNKDKSTKRFYIYIVPEGFISIDASATDHNYDQMDTIAQSMTKHTLWKPFLFMILWMLAAIAILVTMGYLLEAAWNHRKINATKTWLEVLGAIAIALIAAIVLHVWLGYHFWLVFAGLLALGVVSAICFINGIIIF